MININEFLEKYENFIKAREVLEKFYKEKLEKFNAEKGIEEVISKDTGEKINLIDNSDETKKAVAIYQYFEILKNDIVKYTKENLEDLVKEVDKKNKIGIASVIKSKEVPEKLKELIDYKKYFEIYSKKFVEGKEHERYDEELKKLIKESIEKYVREKGMKEKVDDKIEIIYVLSQIDKNYGRRKFEEKLNELKEKIEKINEKDINSYIIESKKGEEDYINIATALYSYFKFQK